MTIHDLSGLVNTALLKANTPNNIINGFKKCGMWPYNNNVFEDYEFAPADTTDLPPPSEEDVANAPPEQSEDASRVVAPIEMLDDQPSTSGLCRRQLTFGSDNSESPRTSFSPELLRPLPKAPPKKRRGGTKRLESAILTDTPEKEAIQMRKKKPKKAKKQSARKTLSSKQAKKKEI